MRAITLWQPHASLMAVGAKKIETRSWKAPSTLKAGDLVAIHAAAKTPPGWLRDFTGLAVVRQLLAEHRQINLEHQAGVIVGVATFVKCLKLHPSGVLDDAGELIEISEQERTLGSYASGRFGWVFEDARPLINSVRVRGYQGVWHVPHTLMSQVFLSAGMGEPWP